MVGVYRITNLATGECYVGQSIHVEKRWKQHFCKGYGAVHNKSFQEAIDSFGVTGFAFEIIEECHPAELEERERYWIAVLKPQYNTIVVGRVIDAEMRSRISDKLRGRKQPHELVEKRRLAILERHKVFPQTNAGHKKKVAVLNEPYEEPVILESVGALAEYLGVNPTSVSKALRGNRKIKGKKVWYVV